MDVRLVDAVMLFLLLGQVGILVRLTYLFGEMTGRLHGIELRLSHLESFRERRV